MSVTKRSVLSPFLAKQSLTLAMKSTNKQTWGPGWGHKGQQQL